MRIASMLLWLNWPPSSTKTRNQIAQQNLLQLNECRKSVQFSIEQKQNYLTSSNPHHSISIQSHPPYLFSWSCRVLPATQYTTCQKCLNQQDKHVSIFEQRTYILTFFLTYIFWYSWFMLTMFLAYLPTFFLAFALAVEAWQGALGTEGRSWALAGHWPQMVAVEVRERNTAHGRSQLRPGGEHWAEWLRLRNTREVRGWRRPGLRRRRKEGGDSRKI